VWSWMGFDDQPIDRQKKTANHVESVSQEINIFA
jgi:hypothetical protein